MIEVSCDQCGKEYRVDETRINNENAKFKCKVCQSPLIVALPEQEESAPSENLDRAVPSASSREKVRINDVMPMTGEDKIWFGLGAKVITIMLIVSLVPLSIFWTILYRESSNQVRNDTEVLMAQIAHGLGNQVEEWIDKNVRVLKTAARLSDTVSMDQSLQEPILKAISEDYPWMYLVFTVDTQGRNVARDDGNPLTDYSDRQYYQDVLSGNTLAWQTLIGRTSGKPALVIAVPIKSGETVTGVMAAAMTIDDISRSVAQWQRGNTGFAFLVDETGKVVSHQVEEYVTSEKNLKDHPLIMTYDQNRKATSISFPSDNEQLVLGHAIGNQYGWTLAVQQDHDEVFKPLRDIQRFAILLLLGTVVLVVVIALISARSITSPIIRLTNAAEKMSLGDLNVKIDIKSRDEIGNLAKAVGRMQTSLRLAIERLRRK